MVLSERFPVTSIYRVEVSGWDMQEVFFVEKAELAWDEKDGQRVRLSRPLRKGSVIFVRLIQSSDLAQSYPIAYEVNPIGPAGGKLCDFRLIQIHPRLREEQPQIH